MGQCSKSKNDLEKIRIFFSIIKKEKENHPFSSYCKIKDENAKICFRKQGHVPLCLNNVLK